MNKKALILLIIGTILILTGSIILAVNYDDYKYSRRKVDNINDNVDDTQNMIDSKIYAYIYDEEPEGSADGVYVLVLRPTKNGDERYCAKMGYDDDYTYDCLNAPYKNGRRLVEYYGNIIDYDPISLGTYNDMELPTYYTPWAYSFGTINKVSIEGKIYPKSTAHWFEDMELKELDLTNLYTKNTTNMSGMFSGLQTESTDFKLTFGEGFDTSNVTDMSFMFWNFLENQKDFEFDFSKWNTSKVTTMEYMFDSFLFSKKNFELDLSNWDTSNVTNMENMFSSAGSYSETFKLKLGDKFSSEKVDNMDGIFMSMGENAKSIDIDLGKAFEYKILPDSSDDLGYLGPNASSFKLKFTKPIIFPEDHPSSFDIGRNLLENETLDVTIIGAFAGNISGLFYGIGGEANTVNMDLQIDTSKVIDMNSILSDLGSDNAKVNIKLGKKINFSSLVDIPQLFAIYECDDALKYNVTTYDEKTKDALLKEFIHDDEIDECYKNMIKVNQVTK